MNRVLLDTSAYSALRRGHPEVLAAVRDAEEIWVNAVVLGELYGGFLGGSQRVENQKNLKRFLSARLARTWLWPACRSRRWASPLRSGGNAASRPRGIATAAAAGSAPEFLDSNILTYAYDPTDPREQRTAQELLSRAGAVDFLISTQVLAEFASILLHQMSPRARPTEVLGAIASFSPLRVIAPDGRRPLTPARG